MPAKLCAAASTKGFSRSSQAADFLCTDLALPCSTFFLTNYLDSKGRWPVGTQHKHLTSGLFSVIPVVFGPSVTAAWRIFSISSQVRTPIVFGTSRSYSHPTRQPFVGMDSWKKMKCVTVDRRLVLPQEDVPELREFSLTSVLSPCPFASFLTVILLQRPLQGTHGQTQG